MNDIFCLRPKSQLVDYLGIREIRGTFDALKSMCADEVGQLELEEQVALTCAEALRYAYRMSKELGISKDTFMEGLGSLMDGEDLDYRSRHFN